MNVPAAAVREPVARALAEDLLPLGDLTASLLPPDATATVRLTAREGGVLAGLVCVTETYAQLDPSISVQPKFQDGSPFGPGAVIASVSGLLAPILTGERTALNFLRHLCGVASLTRQFVDAASIASNGFTRILDTRKTTPGLRALEKAAVRAGGGFNHRANLSDAIMIKDNHLAGLSIADAVKRARAQWPGRPVHVECDTLAQFEEVLATGAERVMLDNFSPRNVGVAVLTAKDQIEVEVTGGITLANVAEYAASKPHFISVGAITHSAGVVDIGLDL